MDHAFRIGGVSRFFVEAKRKEVIQDYAVFGAMAVIRYTEPFPTQDLDVLVAVKSAPLLNLSPIYAAFKALGYEWKGQHLIVEGFPIKFMVADDLELEAISRASRTTIGGERVKVLTPEYLIALAIRTGRAKDIAKVYLLLDQANVRRDVLDDVLARYGLKEKYERLVQWQGQ